MKWRDQSRGERDKRLSLDHRPKGSTSKWTWCLNRPKHVFALQEHFVGSTQTKELAWSRRWTWNTRFTQCRSRLRKSNGRAIHRAHSNSYSLQFPPRSDATNSVVGKLEKSDANFSFCSGPRLIGDEGKKAPLSRDKFGGKQDWNQSEVPTETKWRRNHWSWTQIEKRNRHGEEKEGT